MTDERASEFSAGKAIAVKLPEIEKELAALWRTVAEDAKGRTAVTRACLWNLVVQAESSEAFAHAKRAIDDVSPYLPARVLAIHADRTAPTAPLKAWIEANWHSSGGGSRQIGSDEVTLEARGQTVDDVAAVVRALLVPDVPTAALWYEASPQEDSLDRELLKAADRVVIGGTSERSLSALAVALREHRTRADVIGLAWLRAAPWRSMLASLFDPPAPEGELGTVETVEIRCDQNRIGAALLLVGWLASRLRWSSGRATPDRAHCYQFQRPSGGAVAVTIDLASGLPDPFDRVALTTGAGTYEVARSGGMVILQTPSIAFKQPLHFPEERELWIGALSAQGRDPLFAEALQQISAVAG